MATPPTCHISRITPAESGPPPLEGPTRPWVSRRERRLTARRVWPEREQGEEGEWGCRAEGQAGRADRRPRLGSRAQPGGCKAWSQRTHPLTHPHSLRSGHCGRPGPASGPLRMWHHSCTNGMGGGHRRQREREDLISLIKPMGGRELAGPAIETTIILNSPLPNPPQSHTLYFSPPSSSSLLPPPPAEAQCRMVQRHQHPPGRPAGRGQRAPTTTLLLR